MLTTQGCLGTGGIKQSHRQLPVHGHLFELELMQKTPPLCFDSWAPFRVLSDET